MAPATQARALQSLAGFDRLTLIHAQVVLSTIALEACCERDSQTEGAVDSLLTVIHAADFDGDDYQPLTDCPEEGCPF